MAVPPARRGIVGVLLPVVLAVAALGIGVAAVAATGQQAAALPAAAVVAAALVLGFAPVGRTLPGRTALGIVLVAAAVAIMGVMSIAAGRDPVSTLHGLFVLVASLALLFSGGMDHAPRRATAYAPAVAAVCAAVLMAVRFADSSGAAASLLHGGLYLLLAVLLTATSGAVGPARFATGVVGAALSAALLYFLAISGPGVPAIALAAVFTVAAVAAIGPVDKSRSAESSDADGGVR